MTQTWSLDWTPLDTELAQLDHPLPFWWRDDDAVSNSDALDRLAALSADHGVPVHLAIIPAKATPNLATRLADQASFIPVTHGWAHVSYAPAGEKKAEFGPHRPLGTMLGDAKNGMLRLNDLLGRACAPMFVPPWNRIARDLLPYLPDAGFTHLSTFAPRGAPQAAAGLTCVNTHLDPIDWRGSRSLVAPQTLIDQMARQLADRRLGRADATEPYGLLTHHLVHDPAIWTFTADLLTRLTQAPLAFWTATAPDTGS